MQYAQESVSRWSTTGAENVSTNQLSLTPFFLVGFVASLLLAVANSIWPFVTWSVVAICLLATGLGLVMWLVFSGSTKQAPDSPQVVAELTDEVTANQVAAFLEDNGIKATIVGSYTSGFQTEVAGAVEVVVPLKESAIARNLLEKQRKK